MKSALLRTMAEHADELAQDIHPYLAGEPPELVGAVLCDLLATWLSGHHAGDDEQTGMLRRALLEAHLEKVWQMVELYDMQRARGADVNG